MARWLRLRAFLTALTPSRISSTSSTSPPNGFGSWRPDRPSSPIGVLTIATACSTRLSRSRSRSRLRTSRPSPYRQNFRLVTRGTWLMISIMTSTAGASTSRSCSSKATGTCRSPTRVHMSEPFFVTGMRILPPRTRASHLRSLLRVSLHISPAAHLPLMPVLAAHAPVLREGVARRVLDQVGSTAAFRAHHRTHLRTHLNGSRAETAFA